MEKSFFPKEKEGYFVEGSSFEDSFEVCDVEQTLETIEDDSPIEEVRYTVKITSQVIGCSMAGLMRQVLVRPANMIWPQSLIYAAFFRSLHVEAETEKDLEQGRMSRLKFFALVTLVSFCWYWLPGLFFPTIGFLSWICWIAPGNVVLSQWTGSRGLGLGTITLDWSAIQAYGNPLVTPWFSQVNMIIGFTVMVYGIGPWIYYTNHWGAKQFPILTSQLFLSNGTSYDISMVLDDSVFNSEKYIAYGALRMSSLFAVMYTCGFACVTSTITHVFLYHGHEIGQRWTNAKDENEDIHSRLMRVYPEVPDWWYGLLFLVCALMSIVVCEVCELLPWWCFLLATVFAFVFVLPIGVVQAVTNQPLAINTLAEYVIGSILPGHPIPNSVFKVYAYAGNYFALNFIADLKLGHYMKIPPRTMFAVQLVSTMVATSVNTTTAHWLLETVPGMCSSAGYPFVCYGPEVFFSASVIWGAIGPQRFFGSKDGGLYGSITWGFLFGLLIPIPFWFLARKFPDRQWLRYISWPVILSTSTSIPTTLPYFYPNAVMVGFVFMFWLRRYRFQWWSRYNYLTSAAMDAGVAICGMVIFFAFELPGVQIPFWWGNPDPENPDPVAAALDHCPMASFNYYGR
ncbi:hypothetical protein BGZ83_005073 [Gryganskiella cystojenkinii]|nr:hypothetical protein BGZ83_005073 [Gryganskiella cystojenkinii]